MRIHRTVIALLIFVALVLPQTTKVQSSPRVVDQTVSLQPGDTITINCPSFFRVGKVTGQKVSLVCSNFAFPNRFPTRTKQPIPSPTAIQETMTATPVSDPSAPTATSVPNETASQTPPPNGNTQPYAGAPLCAEHDSTVWHSLWNPILGCHYNHEHGDDPALGNAYFGEAGELWGGQDISYPFNSGASEVGMKHAGYKYSVKTPTNNPWPACGVNSLTDYSPGPNNCVVASRVQYHALGGAGAFFRYHSYYIEAYICKRQGNSYPINSDNCGIIRIGGIADFGDLHVPRYSDRRVRNQSTVDFGEGMIMPAYVDEPDLPSRSVEPYIYTRAQGESPNLASEQWSMNDLDCDTGRPQGTCRNSHARFLLMISDPWFFLNPSNIYDIQFFCRDGSCPQNSSRQGLEELQFDIPQSWQQNGNGFVTFSGYSDRWGNPLPAGSCTTISIDCVPLVLEHVPAGVAGTKSDQACLCNHGVEHDISPAGEHWIEFPN